jgi:hypothetical protein
MAQQTIPNFFIAGAAEAGTISLYHYLNQHPDIFMSPVKEPCYFAQEMRPENFSPELRASIQHAMDELRTQLDSGLEIIAGDGIVARQEDYRKLFQGVREERAVGEASVAYLWSATAAKEIAAFNPAAKIVLILRHPAERAFSNYVYYLADGHISESFSEHLALCLKTDGLMGLHYPFLEVGLYGQQVERLLDHIRQEQVRVWLYEDTTANPAKFFREVLAFLGVDTEFTPDRSLRHVQMEVPKMAGATQILRRFGVWQGLRGCAPSIMRPMLKKVMYRERGSMTMSAEDRRFLVHYYRDDVKRLEHVIARDLFQWLQ